MQQVSRILLLATAIACIIACTYAAAQPTETVVSTQYDPEPHHSLHPPLDKSQVYWNFGGSTVITKNLIRLTPSTQDRRGWLWNEYPLESTNWEVEFKVEVFSKPHFGGDGFGFWVLAGEQDPSFTQNPEALTGPLFGLKQNYKGFGVVFDVYDNDNRRNNPSVFVLSNPTGKVTQYNHDNDYEDDMVKQLPLGALLGTTGVSPKCVADVRNTGKVSKILVKFLHRILHVYIDNNEGHGYKFCLAVQLEDDFKDHHLAFTAATGQVADNHDLLEITTRYLKQTDKDFDDASLYAMTGSGSHHSSWYSLYWFLILSLSSSIAGLAGYSLQQFHTLTLARIDMVQICTRINQYVLPHYALHGVLTFFLLLGGSYYMFFLNFPLLLWRVYEFVKKNFLFSPANIGPAKGHGGNARGVYVKLGAPTALYAVMAVWALFKMIFG